MIPFGLSTEQFRERYRRDLQRAAPGVKIGRAHV